MQLIRVSSTRLALGSDCHIVVVGAAGYNLDSLVDKLWLMVFSFERRFSRFIATSELTRINRSAGKKTKISHAMLQLLEQCKVFNSLTQGTFNPFILPALERAGYDKSAIKGYEKETPNYRDRRVCDFKELNIKDLYVTIPAHSALDLGGIGKGYLADLMLERLKQTPIVGCIISLGGDIAGYGADEKGANWYIGLQDAHKTDQILPGLYQPSADGDFHIATSGVVTRKFAGQHHIIDPITGKSSSSDVELATIVCDNTTSADVFASYAVTLGSQESMRVLPKLGVHSMLLQTGTKRLGTGVFEYYNEGRV